MRDNEFTPFQNDEPIFENSAPKKPRTSRAEPKQSKQQTEKKPKNAANDFNRYWKILGAVLCLFSIFGLIACFSYFLTWKQDQDSVIGHSFFSYIFDNSVSAPDNWLGKMGAVTSHFFVFNGFGIPSIALFFILFLVGFKLLFKTSLLPFSKSLLIALPYMVWGSLFLGFFSDSLNYAGGNFGFTLNQWMFLVVGKIPTFFVHIVLLFATTTMVFNPDYSQWINYFLPKPNTDPVADSTINASNPYETMQTVNPIQENEISEDIISKPVFFDEEEEYMEDDSDLDIAIEDHAPVQESMKNTDTDFEIEIPESSPILEPVANPEMEESFMEENGENYDPTLDLSTYVLPPVDLLKEYGGNGVASVSKEELESNKDKIVETLAHYKIDIAKIKATVGPTVTLYEIIPAPGVRIAKIKNLEDDIALSLSALGIRIIAPIPGKGTIGIEVPNSKPEMVSMKSLIVSEKFQSFDGELPIVIGKTITNETYVFDLTKMPHLLVAGATGQGKSVGLNAILVSLLYKKHPAQVKFVLVDPKKVELTLYNKIERHFLAKLPGEEDAIIVDTSKVVNTLNSLCIEMDDRYELLKNAGVRTIKEYNAKFISRRLNPEKGHRYLPYIVVLIDEFADLIMTAGKEVEHPIARIAQLARAIGIHLIVATQRPSVNVITGMIKANFPARIAFRVLSKIDSRTILDSSGADQLIGRGDMLISTGSDMIRLQCGFVDTPEVEEICQFVGDQRAYPSAFLLPEYVPEGGESSKEFEMDEIDPMFVESARIVVTNQQGSASLLQRKLKLGYNRAGRIVDQLEAMGIIGTFQGSKARDVLFTDLESLDEFLRTKGLL
ncbi:MAG: hypothetical protein RL110_1021 [Bacteroidota bacterium]|jgi:S-DNA-T family DNA segregation ATPase FtsK/SpoIIIE